MDGVNEKTGYAACSICSRAVSLCVIITCITTLCWKEFSLLICTLRFCGYSVFLCYQLLVSVTEVKVREWFPVVSDILWKYFYCTLIWYTLRKVQVWTFCLQNCLILPGNRFNKVPVIGWWDNLFNKSWAGIPNKVSGDYVYAQCQYYTHPYLGCLSAPCFSCLFLSPLP